MLRTAVGAWMLVVTSFKKASNVRNFFSFTTMRRPLWKGSPFRNKSTFLPCGTSCTPEGELILKKIDWKNKTKEEKTNIKETKMFSNWSLHCQVTRNISQCYLHIKNAQFSHWSALSFLSSSCCDSLLLPGDNNWLHVLESRVFSYNNHASYTKAYHYNT